MVKHAGMSKWYWGEGVINGIYRPNRLPTRAQDIHKPFSVWRMDEETAITFQPQSVQLPCLSQPPYGRVVESKFSTRAGAISWLV